MKDDDSTPENEGKRLEDILQLGKSKKKFDTGKLNGLIGDLQKDIANELKNGLLPGVSKENLKGTHVDIKVMKVNSPIGTMYHIIFDNQWGQITLFEDEMENLLSQLVEQIFKK